MPVHKVKGGYKFGKTGKVYPTKAQAENQMKAIYASVNILNEGLRIIGCRTAESKSVENPTVDDIVTCNALKSSGLMKQKVYDDRNVKN